ncbi:MAG: hypothetical protein NUW37_19635 [Planctomycetes bacterium]|nr:hypothetical protein [Planctomycetota bacterium]
MQIEQVILVSVGIAAPLYAGWIFLRYIEAQYTNNIANLARASSTLKRRMQEAKKQAIYRKYASPRFSVSFADIGPVRQVEDETETAKEIQRMIEEGLIVPVDTAMEDLMAGMVIAKPVFDDEGREILRTGVELDDSIIDALAKNDIETVWICYDREKFEESVTAQATLGAKA